MERETNLSKICLNPHHYTPVTPDLQGLSAFPPTSALKLSRLLCLNYDCTPGKAGRPWISMALAGATQRTIQCLVPSLVDELQACNRRRASCIPACFCVTDGLIQSPHCLIQPCSSVTSAVCSVLQGCTPLLLMTSGRGQEWFRKKPGSQPYLSWHKDRRRGSLVDKADIPSTQAALAQRKSGLIKCKGMPSWSFRVSLKRPE